MIDMNEATIVGSLFISSGKTSCCRSENVVLVLWCCGDGWMRGRLWSVVTVGNYGRGSVCGKGGDGEVRGGVGRGRLV